MSPGLQISETETTFHYCWRVKSSFKLVWMESTIPMQLTDWLLIEVALLLIGLSQISFRLSAQRIPCELHYVDERNVMQGHSPVLGVTKVPKQQIGNRGNLLPKPNFSYVCGDFLNGGRRQKGFSPSPLFQH
jgi:hypothetical protein